MEPIVDSVLVDGDFYQVAKEWQWERAGNATPLRTTMNDGTLRVNAYEVVHVVADAIQGDSERQKPQQHRESVQDVAAVTVATLLTKEPNFRHLPLMRAKEEHTGAE